MKTKRPIIFLAIAIAVAVIVLIVENPRRSRVDDVGDETFSPGFDSAKVWRVEITQLLQGAELKRDGERWFVGEMLTPLKEELVIRERREEPGGRWFRANRMRVNSALGSFGGLPQGVVVSMNKEKRRFYQVEATGLHVRLLDKDGGVIEDLIVGKNGPDMASSYVRRAGEDEVYLVRRSLAGVFTPTASNWRERKLWSLDPEDITGISISSNDGPFEVRRGESSGMQGMAQALSSVSAEGFAEDQASEPGRMIIDLKLAHKSGGPFRLKIYERNDRGLYPARLEGVDEIYLLSKKFVESIPRTIPEKK